MSREERGTRTLELFARVHDADEAERDRILSEVVVLHLEVAASMSRRYRNRGVDDDDLRQVAWQALTKAAHRFDPDNGAAFMAFVKPCVLGELRKHFRDHGWTIRPTRVVQELQVRAGRTADAMESESGRRPTHVEVAARLGEDPALVGEALALTQRGCFTPNSLDAPAAAFGDGTDTLGSVLGGVDPGMDAAEARAVLGPVLGRLAARDQLILRLRFLESRTQREIALEIGVTQMQVSRLLNRIYAQLRQDIGEVQPAA